MTKQFTMETKAAFVVDISLGQTLGVRPEENGAPAMNSGEYDNRLILCTRLVQIHKACKLLTWFLFFPQTPDYLSKPCPNFRYSIYGKETNRMSKYINAI